MDTYRSSTIWMLMMGGLFAGILAYTISSRRAARQLSTQEMLFEKAKEIGGNEIARTSREYVSERVIPEMKPVLIDLLKDAEAYVDRYFQRAEKAIKSM